MGKWWVNSGHCDNRHYYFIASSQYERTKQILTFTRFRIGLTNSIRLEKWGVRVGDVITSSPLLMVVKIHNNRLDQWQSKSILWKVYSVLSVTQFGICVNQ